MDARRSILPTFALALVLAAGAVPAPAQATSPFCYPGDSFCDDMTDRAATAAFWTASASSDSTCTGTPDPTPLTAWELRDRLPGVPPLFTPPTPPSVYWNVGIPGGEGYVSCAVATLTSDAIDLDGATAPELVAWLEGSSETDFDVLRVFVDDLATSQATLVLEVSASASTHPGGVSGVQTADLTGTGSDVRLRFEFQSDSTIVDGLGWDLGPVAVREA